MGVYIYKGHTEVMITIHLQTNASLLQCVITCIWSHLFPHNGWKSCHKLPSCVCIALWENGWEGHVLLVMCSNIISVKQDILTSDIHVWHQCSYEDSCIGAGNVRRRIYPFKGRNTDVAGQLTASAEGNKENSILSERIDACQSQKWQQSFR